MHVSLSTTVATHDAFALIPRSGSTHGLQTKNVDSKDPAAVGTRQDVDLGANAVTTPIDEVPSSEIIPDSDVQQLKHAKNRAMKELRDSAKTIIKTAKEETKDLIKSLGITGLANAGARHEINGFSRAVRIAVKDARSDGDVDAAALGEVLQEEFDTFLSGLAEVLGETSPDSGKADDHSVDLDPNDTKSIDGASAALAPDEITVTDIAPDDDDKEADPADPLKEGLDRIVAAFRDALANLLSRFDLPTPELRHDGAGGDLRIGLIVDTHA